MSTWISVKDSLPDPWHVVWIYWRDREVLLGCRTIVEENPSDGWYSFDDGKCRWTNWWMPVDASSYDGPNAPKENQRMNSMATTVLYCKFCYRVFGRYESQEDYLKKGTQYVCEMCNTLHWTPSPKPPEEK